MAVVKIMEFSLEKKGYSPKEVEKFITELKDAYEETSAAQKDRINELKNQLSVAEKELKAYRDKSGLVSSAILSAVSKADEIERLSQIKYNQEMGQLQAFHDKWSDYYGKILERYPLDDQLLAAGRFNMQMAKILERTGKFSQQEQINAFTQSDEPFFKESERQNETQIGYIKVRTDENEQASTLDNEFDDIVPGSDPNSPIISGNFNPLERINRYLQSEKTKAQKSSVRADKNSSERANSVKSSSEKNQQANKRRSSETACAVDNITACAVDNIDRRDESDYTDRTPSGFSFEEALNPKDDLAQIMRDLGLLMDE